MSTVILPPHRDRTPHRVVVQYRHEAHAVPGVRIAEHYGRGVPVRHSWVNAPALTADQGDARAESVAARWRAADNGIAPESIVVKRAHVTVY